jgi:hypothetical protein
MSVSGGPNISEDGLVLALDAGNVKSYPGSGTTWNDLSGNNNNGTLTNGPTFDGGNGGNVVFDGSNDFVNIPYSGTTANTYTFSITMKCNTMDSNDANRQTLFGLSQNGNPAFRQFDVEIFGNTGRGFRGDGGSTENVNFFNYSWNLDKDANNINVYTVTLTPTYHSIYVNGELKTTVNRTITAPFNSIILGSRLSGNLWNGRCYNFNMYTRELSPQEILQNFNATRSRFNI